MAQSESQAQYQSLYRRFRPQRFSEVKGQDHVVLALQNAVRDDRVGHAYLFSGPRGTGKTSSARILAKALNCEAIQDGEPCCVCESCIAVQDGASLDVHELDAASNNGVDAMRDLVSRAALGTPGRWKVYIIDEVHMLSTAASNALLKTLEEPPGHVVFVLATTDPQKVLPTIRSRTQHFAFRLLPADVMADLVKDIRTEAHIDVADEAMDFVVRRGNGSARDALSLLDQVAASGSAHDSRELLDDIMTGFIENDTAQVLTAIAESIHAGSDARQLATDIVEHLRNAFLATTSKGLVALPDEAIERVGEQAHQLGLARTVRIMETMGQALVDMRDTVDPRLTLELAAIRATTPPTDGSVPPELLDRIERLEHQVQSAPTPTAPTPATSTKEPKAALGAVAKAPRAAKVAEAPRTVVRREETAQATKPSPKSSTPTTQSPTLTRDELVKAWGDQLLETLPQRAKARFRVARFTNVEDGVVTCEMPNEMHRVRSEEVSGEVEAVLSSHFSVPVRLKLIVGTAPEETSTQPTQEQEDVHIDPADLTEVTDPATSLEDRLKEMFPGAEEV